MMTHFGVNRDKIPRPKGGQGNRNRKGTQGGSHREGVECADESTESRGEDWSPLDQESVEGLSKG